MTSTTSQPGAAIPPDDANRKLTVADPDDPKLRHVSVAGGTYTILVSGEQTGGRYCLIDMLVPAGEHRVDREHPRQCAPLVQEHVGQAGTPALHVHASGTGGVLHGGRRPRRQPHRAAAAAQQS